MVFRPADGQTARWRRADEYIDARKLPGELISFREIQDLLDIDKATAAAVIHQVRIQRERAGKPTLVTMRGAGWLLARPDQELDEDSRRHERLLNTSESRLRLLGSLQRRRAELTDDERRTMDFELRPLPRPPSWAAEKHRPPTSSAQAAHSPCRSRHAASSTTTKADTAQHAAGSTSRRG